MIKGISKVRAISGLLFSGARMSSNIPKCNNLSGFIEHYQENGHKFASIDPLGLTN
jgi:2-oxoglutarate dehydrogenase complex dehydrogenase (E1) component-like enzyme